MNEWITHVKPRICYWLVLCKLLNSQSIVQINGEDDVWYMNILFIICSCCRLVCSWWSIFNSLLMRLILCFALLLVVLFFLFVLLLLVCLYICGGSWGANADEEDETARWYYTHWCIAVSPSFLCYSALLQQLVYNPTSFLHLYFS